MNASVGLMSWLWQNSAHCHPSGISMGQRWSLAYSRFQEGKYDAREHSLSERQTWYNKQFKWDAETCIKASIDTGKKRQPFNQAAQNRSEGWNKGDFFEARSTSIQRSDGSLERTFRSNRYTACAKWDNEWFDINYSHKRSGRCSSSHHQRTRPEYQMERKKACRGTGIAPDDFGTSSWPVCQVI